VILILGGIAVVLSVFLTPTNLHALIR